MKLLLICILEYYGLPHIAQRSMEIYDFRITLRPSQFLRSV